LNLHKSAFDFSKKTFESITLGRPENENVDLPRFTELTHYCEINAGRDERPETGGRLSEIVLCSECFHDEGLRLDAKQIGVAEDSVCPNCGSQIGEKLTAPLVEALAHRFFVRGTLRRFDYGAAPRVQFNARQKTSIKASTWFEADLRLIESILHVGFFYYGPRLWMVGEVEPLKALEEPRTRPTVVKRILEEYPARTLSSTQSFYRLRKNPANPDDPAQYDSPPSACLGANRFDSIALPIMYGSQVLQVCIHECRVTAEDQLYIATLAPSRDLRLLDLTELLKEEHVTEFESLDMAVHMLFLAGEHSYDISREIAATAHATGHDGLIYPSYFSLLCTGAMPFETSLGISHRRFPSQVDREKSKIIPNLALFGRPIEQRIVEVRCINKLILQRVEYWTHFGPVGV
jgi:hypothetical protein